MAWLEARVPPVVWLASCGLLAWIVDRADIDGGVIDGTVVTAIAVVLAVVGLAFGAAGIGAFGRARTTVNPHRIERASALVTGGAYRVTRNPMYLGLLLLLVAWCLVLGSLIALLVSVAVFLVVMTRLQIQPEERVLEERFGDDFRAYRARVRRWL